MRSAGIGRPADKARVSSPSPRFTSSFARARKMEPESEWEFEVVRRVRAGEDEEAALTAVLQEFLGAGDPRPLIDMGRAGRPVPALARSYIAQMFDESSQSNEPSPTYFDVQRRYRTVTDEARRRREWFEAGKTVLDNNQDPGWMFWLVFARA